MKDRLYIDINNDPKILQVILDSLSYLDSPWTTWVKMDNSYWKEHYPNETARYFGFNFSERRFLWASYDTSKEYHYSVPDHSHVHFNPVRNISDASRLMDYVYYIDKTDDFSEDSPESGKWKLSKAIPS